VCDDDRKEALRRLRSPRAPVFWGPFPTTEALGQLREAQEGDIAFVNDRAYARVSGGWSPLEKA